MIAFVVGFIGAVVAAIWSFGFLVFGYWMASAVCGWAAVALFVVGILADAFEQKKSKRDAERSLAA